MRTTTRLFGLRNITPLTLATLFVVSTVGVAPAQTTIRQTSATPDLSGIELKPGERIISVDGVPVSGAAAATATQGSAAAATNASGKTETRQQRSSGPVRNIVGRLVRSGMPFSHTPGETALAKANHERRKNGVGNLIPDPQLQQLALKKAKLAAARGIKNHVGGSLGGARAEGVGHTQGRFLSCCLDMPATYGGAAMVQGADGWYCCLLVR